MDDNSHVTEWKKWNLSKDNNNDIKSIVKLGKSKLESRSGLLGGNIIMEDVEGRDRIYFLLKWV